MARTSSPKKFRPLYSKRAVRKRILNFIALSTFNNAIREKWLNDGDCVTSDAVNMWRDIGAVNADVVLQDASTWGKSQ